jgi:CRISPR system Cascade subunit CasD
MTATLLLRLEGPMQSWGTQSRFRVRDTGREPSKSGVVGLLCAALGRPRGAPLADLAALRMGVRVDREGVVREDYQTAGGGAWLNGRYGVTRAENPGVEVAISRRAYLSDASFLVGLEAAIADQEALLARLDTALRAPVWPLYLGRKGYVPGAPVRLPDAPEHGGPGLVGGALLDALRGVPVAPSRSREGGGNMLRLVIETDFDNEAAEVRQDQPVSFASDRRVFASRAVKVSLEPRPARGG